MNEKRYLIIHKNYDFNSITERTFQSEEENVERKCIHIGKANDYVEERGVEQTERGGKGGMHEMRSNGRNEVIIHSSIAYN